MSEKPSGEKPRSKADMLDRIIEQRAKIERLQKQHDNFLQEFWKTNAENERLRAGINKAGSLALQKASHELIRQVLSEAIREHSTVREALQDGE